MGTDVRDLMHITLVCFDVFDNKRHKYLNWKKYRQIYDKSKVKYQSDNEFDQQSDFEFLYSLPSSIFNPCCQSTS